MADIQTAVVHASVAVGLPVVEPYSGQGGPYVFVANLGAFQQSGAGKAIDVREQRTVVGVDAPGCLASAHSAEERTQPIPGGRGVARTLQVVARLTRNGGGRVGLVGGGVGRQEVQALGVQQEQHAEQEGEAGLLNLFPSRWVGEVRVLVGFQPLAQPARDGGQRALANLLLDPTAQLGSVVGRPDLELVHQPVGLQRDRREQAQQPAPVIGQ